MQGVQGKKLLVVGGTGYVGQQILRQGVKIGMEMISVSRSGQGSSSVVDPKITYVKGDSMDAASFEDALREADAVVHTIGTLIDSTILKGKKIGEIGKINPTPTLLRRPL